MLNILDVVEMLLDVMDDSETIRFLTKLTFKKEKETRKEYVTMIFSCEIKNLLITVSYYFDESIKDYTMKYISVDYKENMLQQDGVNKGFWKDTNIHNWYVPLSENLFNHLLKL